MNPINDKISDHACCSCRQLAAACSKGLTNVWLVPVDEDGLQDDERSDVTFSMTLTLHRHEQPAP